MLSSEDKCSISLLRFGDSLICMACLQLPTVSFDPCAMSFLCVAKPQFFANFSNILEIRFRFEFGHCCTFVGLFALDFHQKVLASWSWGFFDR